MPRFTVDAPDAPAPVGPYAHAAGHDQHGMLYLSGQTPIDPATNALVDGDVAEQAHRVFTNLGQVLAAAGRTLSDVVKVNVYLVDMADFAAVNEVYARAFDQPYPARTTVAVAGLPLGARVEIELVAGPGTMRT
ncbi:Rid family detoxifying hydrolase [Blastococcus saxobsidens]|uniref:Endoribonuclease n=1 Tax=Blastococcus saxobsidens (strain DD2) TaxID=1146883 RepID=H6RMF7_BLASD|nr:Rid family detoxifying hydrolase [Blastococcus saxobsidens]CCG02593.1 Endoribonuclease [Blastococcus saxobsidens DD2]